MPEKTSLPECRRCHSSIAQPVVEKDAGEWIVRCLDCGAGNVLQVNASTRRFPLPMVEIVGWMG